MEKMFLCKQAKIVVDILLVVSFIVAGVVLDRDIMADSYWRSSHCIFGVVWFLLIVLHVYQNWKMIRAFTKRKVWAKNKVTGFTIVTFILMFLSIVSFLFGIHIPLVHFHQIVARLFVLSIIVHIIQKFKRFMKLF